MRTTQCFAALAALFLLAVPALAFEREKTDVITLVNGDRVTGEILSLKFGILEIKTSNMGTIRIEWPVIRQVDSKHSFFVERVGAGRYYGPIHTSADQLVIPGEEPVQIPMVEVTRLSQVESSFWHRIHGSIAVGFNYTKSSDISVSSLAFNSAYRSERIESTLGLSMLTTTSPDSGTTDRNQLTSNIRFLRPRKNFWLMLTTLERNEELGIEGRLQLGGAMGRYLRQRSDSELTAYAGLSFNQEWSTGKEGTQQSLEGVLGSQWRIFRFSEPEVTLTSSLQLYPSITDSGRYRGELSTTLSRDLIEDLTLDLSFYGSYDSDPPDATVEKDDYGVVTSLGYKF